MKALMHMIRLELEESVDKLQGNQSRTKSCTIYRNFKIQFDTYLFQNYDSVRFV